MKRFITITAAVLLLGIGIIGALPYSSPTAYAAGASKEATKACGKVKATRTTSAKTLRAACGFGFDEAYKKKNYNSSCGKKFNKNTKAQGK